MIRLLTCFLFAVLIYGCHQNNDHNYVGPLDSSKVGKIRKVVILGNSIVYHAPKDSLGWSGSWGMAASERDSDFVHILIRQIKAKSPQTEIQYKAIVPFEQGYRTYDYSQLDSFKNADMIIMKIGENVDQHSAKDSGFINKYNSLISYLSQQNKPVVITCDGFWDLAVNRLIQDNAVAKDFALVQISDLSFDSTNMALREFKDPGVSHHPSNKGMRIIEERIWSAISPYF